MDYGMPNDPWAMQGYTWNDWDDDSLPVEVADTFEGPQVFECVVPYPGVAYRHKADFEDRVSETALY